MDLAGALDLGATELVAFVGAGGKKTAMKHLVGQGAGSGRRVGYTTTTHMPPPDGVPLVVTGDDVLPDGVDSKAASVALARERVANPSRADRKVRGFSPSTVDALFDRGDLDWVLVKADGARRREFKAPGPDEPVIPTTATSVLPFVSVTAIGKTLDEETVHRTERVAAITDTDVGEEVTPETVAAVLASRNGALKHVPPSATVTPGLNKADAPARQDTARRTLSLALVRTDRCRAPADRRRSWFRRSRGARPDGCGAPRIQAAWTDFVRGRLLAGPGREFVGLHLARSRVDVHLVQQVVVLVVRGVVLDAPVVVPVARRFVGTHLVRALHVIDRGLPPWNSSGFGHSRSRLVRGSTITGPSRSSASSSSPVVVTRTRPSSKVRAR
jgi:probable selenium-dependent hydroxylase accessory protein YqeC